MIDPVIKSAAETGVYVRVPILTRIMLCLHPYQIQCHDGVRVLYKVYDDIIHIYEVEPFIPFLYFEHDESDKE